jgi:hypothetical protein
MHPVLTTLFHREQKTFIDAELIEVERTIQERSSAIASTQQGVVEINSIMQGLARRVEEQGRVVGKSKLSEIIEF